MLMMRAPLASAHSRPATICRVVASGDCRPGRERVHREHAGARRNANQLAVRDDSAGHAGAVRMRLLIRLADRVVSLTDRAGEFGMTGSILESITATTTSRPVAILWTSARRSFSMVYCSGDPARRPCCLRRCVLHELVDVVRRRNTNPLGLQRAHHVGNLPSRRQAEMIERAAGDAALLHADDGQAEPAWPAASTACRDTLGPTWNTISVET